jgi:predicted acyl esterase
MRALIHVAIVVLVVLLSVLAQQSQAAGNTAAIVHNNYNNVPQVDTLPELLEFGFVEADITAADGVILKSLYFDAKSEFGAGAKNPTVVFISSWGLNKWEYVTPAKDLAARGYTVVSYTSRGFWGSGGEISMAGPLDQQDVSTVIDWAIANLNTDASRIGLSGISYGGGSAIIFLLFRL